MAIVKQHRATNANLALKIPAQSQLVHNTETNRIHIGDGTKAGGHAAAKLDEVVRHDAAQSLTSAQKEQARSNIGASSFDPQNTAAIELNRLGSGNRSSYVDLHAADGGADYHARILRSGGVNGAMLLTQTGTGVVNITGGSDFQRDGKHVLVDGEILKTASIPHLSGANEDGWARLSNKLDGGPGSAGEGVGVVSISGNGEVYFMYDNSQVVSWTTAGSMNRGSVPVDRVTGVLPVNKGGTGTTTGIPTLPIPTSSVLPVGYSCTCAILSGTVNNNATIAGGSLGSLIMRLTGGPNGYMLNNGIGSRLAALTGVWRNISGGTITAAPSEDMQTTVGLFVRVS